MSLKTLRNKGVKLGEDLKSLSKEAGKALIGKTCTVPKTFEYAEYRREG